MGEEGHGPNQNGCGQQGPDTTGARVDGEKEDTRADGGSEEADGLCCVCAVPPRRSGGGVAHFYGCGGDIGIFVAALVRHTKTPRFTSL